MKYMTVKQAAEKWAVSGAMVRRYCKEGKIANAVLSDDGWKIPKSAKKPNNTIVEEKVNLELSPLAKTLVRQKKKKSFHGLYDYVVVDLTYSSNRMASNRLTRNQVSYIYTKGKVKEMFEPLKVSDLIETLNHIRCVNYIIDNIKTPLTIKLIRQLHSMLTAGTVDTEMNRVEPGEYRNAKSLRKENFIGSAATIATSLKNLLDDYERTAEVTKETILGFHVDFGRIFPFEDYNGRVGRLLLFKECLRHYVIPFIIDDKRRGRYLNGLRQWNHDKSILMDVTQECQERFASEIYNQHLAEIGVSFRPADYKED